MQKLCSTIVFGWYSENTEIMTSNERHGSYRHESDASITHRNISSSIGRPTVSKHVCSSSNITYKESITAPGQRIRSNDASSHGNERCWRTDTVRLAWIFMATLNCVIFVKNVKTFCSFATAPRETYALDTSLSYAEGVAMTKLLLQENQRVETKTKWSDVKLAIYMTTHLSTTHISFLPCWYDAIQRLEIFQYADLVLYTSSVFDPVPTEILHQLPFRNNVIIKYYNNTGYQNGAIQAMIDPFKLEDNDVDSNDNVKSWFNGYDWVIRLNPDVLIRNDTWLIETMMNTSIDAIFHDCFNRKLYPFNNDRQIPKFHSDFVAFRPLAVRRDLILSVPLVKLNHLNRNVMNAEMHLTESFWNIYQSKRFAYLEGGENSKPGRCRLEGMHSPVLHVHQLAKFCPFYYNVTKDGLF